MTRIPAAIAGLTLLLTGLIACETPAEQTDGEPAEEQNQSESPPDWQAPASEADEVAAGVFEAHGGPAWDEVGRLEFRFVVDVQAEVVADVAHDWNVVDSRDRVRWETEEGEQMEVLVDLDDERALEATRGGERLEGEERQKAAADAYRRWVNDAYWLLMPIKLFDPGVERSLEEPVEDRGEEADVIELSFDDVGLTPGDRYRVRVDRENRRVLSWEMMLEGSDEPAEVDWKGYEEFGPLWLPTERQWRNKDQAIRFEDVAVQRRSERS